MDYKYNGIVLGKYDVGETDRIYTIYTKEAGKVRTLASGVRKPQAKLAGSLEPITLSEIFVAKRRGMGKITSVIVNNNFLNIKSNLDSLQVVLHTIGKLEKFFPEGEKDEKVFALLTEFLETIEKISEKKADKDGMMEVISLGFWVKFLSQAGYQLEVNSCVHCGKRIAPGNNYFSAEKGGILCGSCCQIETLKIPITTEAIKLMRIFLRNEIKNLVKLKVLMKEIRNLQSIVGNMINWVI